MYPPPPPSSSVPLLLTHHPPPLPIQPIPPNPPNLPNPPIPPNPPYPHPSQFIHPQPAVYQLQPTHLPPSLPITSQTIHPQPTSQPIHHHHTNQSIEFDPANPNFNHSLGHLPKMQFPQFDGDNPKLWLSRAKSHFEMYFVHPSVWVRVATHHMTHAAAHWLQSVETSLTNISWESFSSLIHVCFSHD
jgi:hypothetical protein